MKFDYEVEGKMRAVDRERRGFGYLFSYEKTKCLNGGAGDGNPEHTLGNEYTRGWSQGRLEELETEMKEQGGQLFHCSRRKGGGGW